ncbi:Fe-S cluster assembly ATPase SufC [bacterium]|nr:Fe-S cluster assembly ATPase SufC [bacterium]
MFEVKNLEVSVEDKKIVNDLSLSIKAGEVHAIMGRNGSGKTTLANSLMGHPAYTVLAGKVILDGEDITECSPDERAKKRLFLGFQYPVAVPGVSLGNFLRTSLGFVRGEEIPKKELRKLIKSEATALNVPDDFLSRSLNEGFSGGEKKRIETLQMQLLQPKVAIMDETDSGLDIDALKLVAEKINSLRSPDRGILLITHYQRLLEYIKPDQVHVMIKGKIVKSGGASLALDLESRGYDEFAGASNG